jgi:hypothetical protein
MRELRALYAEIAAEDPEVMGDRNRELVIERRTFLFRKWRGRFLEIFRSQSGKTFSEIEAELGFTQSEVLAIEKGERAVDDPKFYAYTEFLGAGHQLSGFLLRVEEAFKPGLREARLKKLKAIAQDRE